MNKYIIIDADPFCFGPISTSLNIVRELKKRVFPYEIVLLGINTTVQLAESTGLFDRIVSFNTTDEEEFIKNGELIQNAQLYLSNTNAASIQYLNQYYPLVRKIFVDTLFWMWDKLYADFRSVEKYYIQNFYGVKEQLETFQGLIINEEVVNPIINIQAKYQSEKEDMILVNLGGIENIYTGKTEFYHFFAEKLLSVFKQQEWNKQYKIYLCGGGKTIDELRTLYHNPSEQFYVGVLGQKEYLSKLSTCKYFLSMPGLTSFYESLFYRANTYFLLPQNYSQYLQLCAYRSHDSRIKGVSWDDFSRYVQIKPFIPEIEGIALIKQCVEQFLQSEADQNKFFQDIVSFLYNEKEGWIESSLFFEHSGAVEIANGIIGVLEKGEKE